MNKKMLKKYAQLIVKTGVNVQPGQKVIVYGDLDQAELVHEVVEASYQAGAKLVSVEWGDAALQKLNFRYAAEKDLSKVLPWQEAKIKQQVKDLPCLIHIVSDDPDALRGIDIPKMMKVRQARSKATKKYRDQMDNKYQWVIAAAASKKWAKKVFPEETTKNAVEKLWKLIFDCVYLDETNDPNQIWDEHNKDFLARCEWLNSQNFDHLIYESANGTNFTVGLIPGAKFMGGGEYSTQNIYYNPNMPTEEIFTSPMKGRAEGKVVATKPLSYQGQLIEDFSITFKDGKAVECSAREGEELLRQMLAMDEGAGYLGEVALVPKESPVNRSGVLFYETLFDENACCHLAVGRGFTNVLEGFEEMTLEQTKEAGINDSLIHVDFMIGSDDLRITGVKADGTKVAVFENGTWAQKV